MYCYHSASIMGGLPLLVDPPLVDLLLSESRGADILDIVRYMYRAVGGSIIVRIGEDLYMGDGRAVEKPGDVIQARILAHFPL